MPVDPHLDWPRTVRADLDERRTEIGVPEVEVVDRDPAVLLVEGELRRLGRVGVALAGDEHPLRLLRHPDRGDLRTPLTRSRIQISTHHFDVAVGGFQPHHRNVVGIGVGGDRAAKRIADLLQARRGGHHIPAVPQELHHLPTHLQLGEIPIQVDPVQTLEIEAHVPVEHIVDRDRVDPHQTRRHDDLRNQTL